MFRVNNPKPSFAAAMARARGIVTSHERSPPLSRSEVFNIYRACRCGGSVMIRCSFINTPDLTADLMALSFR